MTNESEPQKPEWFELADSSAPSTHVTRVNKKLPAIAVLVTGAIIATGAFFASASENENGDDHVATTNFNPADNPVIGDTTTAGGITAPGNGMKDPSQGGVRKPGDGDGDQFGERPHWDGDSDGDGHEFGDRPPHPEGEGRERHERGEHGERGTAPVIPSTSGTTSKSA